MINNPKDMETQFIIKRDFLTWLVLFFAIGAGISVIQLILKCGWLPDLSGSTTFAVDLSFLISVLYYIVLGALLRPGRYGLTRMSRFGIILMISQKLMNQITVSILAHYPEAHLQLSLLHAAFTVIYIVGIIMFIHGSPADRNLKKFVKWTPFINMIATIFLSSASVIADKTQIMSSPGYHIIFTTINLAVFLTVYHMARRSILSATTGS